MANYTNSLFVILLVLLLMDKMMNHSKDIQKNNKKSQGTLPTSTGQTELQLSMGMKALSCCEGSTKTSPLIQYVVGKRFTCIYIYIYVYVYYYTCISVA